MVEWILLLSFAGGAYVVHRHYSKRYLERGKDIEDTRRDVVDGPSVSNSGSLTLRKDSEPSSPSAQTASLALKINGAHDRLPDSIDQFPELDDAPDVVSPIAVELALPELSVRSWRGVQGLSVQEVAKLATPPTSTVSQIDNETRSLADDARTALASAFQMRPDQVQSSPDRLVLATGTGNIPKEQRNIGDLASATPSDTQVDRWLIGADTVETPSESSVAADMPAAEIIVTVPLPLLSIPIPTQQTSDQPFEAPTASPETTDFAEIDPPAEHVNLTCTSDSSDVTSNPQTSGSVTGSGVGGSTDIENERESASKAVQHIGSGMQPLRTWRMAKGLPIHELSRRAGVLPSTIEQIENGTRTATIELLETLAKSLQIEPTLLSSHLPIRTVSLSDVPKSKKASTKADSAHGTPKWVEPHETIEVDGHLIAGGMFYFGHGLRDPGRNRPDPSLVDPSLKVAKADANISGASIPYWPSYSEIAPSSRLAYLQWLADGRSDPSYGICYPFIFLYGLERRLLYDGVHADAPVVVAELDRLLAIYDRDYSFRRYASKLRDAAYAYWQDAPAPTLSPKIWNGEDLPAGVKVYLGRHLRTGSPLDSDQALLWLLGLPDTRTRTPVERCFDEARALWRHRFDEKHPSGLKLNIPKRNVRIDYSAASGSFQIQICPTMSGLPLPDIGSLSAPLKWMRETLERCSDELSGYSRLVGRRTEAKGTLDAALLLPPVLHRSEFGKPVEVARRGIEEVLADRDCALLETRKLLTILEVQVPAASRLSASASAQIGSILGRLGFGMEPDRRYGPLTASLEGSVVLFVGADGSPVDGDRETYRAMRTMVEVAALAAASNDKVDASEIAVIRADIMSAPELDQAERLRLVAFASFLLQTNAGQGSILSRLGKMPGLDKRRVAKSALSAVLADGHATPAEIRFLEKLYKTLSLPMDEVYSAVHRGAIAVDEPTIVAAAEPSTGVPIPVDDREDAFRQVPAVSVDLARLERIRSETSAVSQLLASIFEDEEASSPAISSSIPTDTENRSAAFEGLDPAHASLLRSVLVKVEISPDEFADLARRSGLLPDGAIETINEWAFDRFDEPVLEAEGRVTVPDHLRNILIEDLEINA